MNKTMYILLGMILLCAALVQAIPGTIDSVKADGDELNTAGGNAVSLQRGQSFDVKVRVSATSPIPNAEIVAFITGFDFASSKDRISDSSGVFDMSNNNTVIKTLSLTLPDRADKANYRLRVVFADRNGDEITKDYPIVIDPPRHSVVIKDVVLNPSENIEAGRSLLASVHLKNIGDKNEQDLKVTVEIPDIDLTATDYIKEVKSDESATSQEMFFRIPACVKSGTYPVQVVVEYMDGYRSVTKEQSIKIIGSSTCGLQNPSVTQPAIVTVSPSSTSLMQGQGGNYITIAITNPSTTSKSFIVVADSQSGVQTRFSPSNVVVVPQGGMQSVYLFLAADTNAPKGSQALTVTVKDMAGSVVSSSAIRVDVTPSSASSGANSFDFDSDSIVQMLVIGLVVLLVVLFVFGVYLVMNKPPKSDQPPRTTLNKTYY